MNKLFKILSTVLIVIGLEFVFYYILKEQISRGTEIFDNPSYYIRQNYLYVFFAGSVVILFSLIGSFLAWHKNAEPKEEILPNAGFSQKEEIAAWLEGSTLDTAITAEKSDINIVKVTVEKTEVLNKEEKTAILNAEESTEILYAEEKTELTNEEERTEILNSEEKKEREA